MVTIVKAWPIQLFVGNTSWATPIGLCQTSYLLAEVAALEMTRIEAHLYGISSLLNKAEGFPNWSVDIYATPRPSQNETEH